MKIYYVLTEQQFESIKNLCEYGINTNHYVYGDILRTLNKADKTQSGTQGELARYKKAIIEATLSFKAIGEPAPNDPPDARVCGVIARSALVRINNALLQSSPASTKISEALEHAKKN